MNSVHVLLIGDVHIRLKKIRGRQVTNKLNMEKLKNEEERRKFGANFQDKAATLESTPENKTWTLRRSEEKRLEAFEMWIWRRMERAKWTDRIRNEAVLERWGMRLIRRRGLATDWKVRGSIPGGNRIFSRCQTFRTAPRFTQPPIKLSTGSERSELAHLNLAQLLERRGRYEEAISVYRRCSRLNGAGLKDPRTHEATKISALLHLGRLYADQGRLHKAVAMYQEAVDRMPEHYPPQAVYTLLGEAHSRLQQHEEAERWYQAALQAEPGHVPAHLTYGSMLARNSLIVEEEVFCLATKDSSRSTVIMAYFQTTKKGYIIDPTIGIETGSSQQEDVNQEEINIYLPTVDYFKVKYKLEIIEKSRTVEAEQWFQRATELAPNDPTVFKHFGK
ncbi:hypothetical protein ANN_04825 [Periplaneta americana]|uniref:Uncharacterized protein n=1 Tax=Periplaneta americana TaxID=6978 RepID=A0ABQ8TBX4_PERAM|nr:hypothetical protein ANN_04825 [Periplaneta americana]